MKQENIWKKSVMTGFMLLCLLPAGGCFGLAFAEEAEQAQEYIFPESDGEYLTEEELAGLPLQVIAYGKYEIFARRGMLFQSEELQNYFSGQNWYFGFIEEEEFPDSLLNEIETANLQLLGEQEEALSEGGYQTDQEGFAYDLIEAYLAGEEISEAGPAENTGEVPEGREAGEEETDQTEPESEAVAETESETVTGAETEAESETETESESEAVAEAETEPESEAVTEAETEAETEPENETETEAETESESEAVAEAETKTESEAVTEAETEAGTEPESEAVTEAEAETETEPEEGLDLNGYEDVHGIDMMGGQSEQIQTTGSEYIFPDVASRYLSRSEVEALSLQAICYAKNEIYARHGRKFVSRELQEYFGSKSWYDGFVEPESFADWVFNDYERANLDLIVSCELAIRSDGYQLDQPGYDIHAVNTASGDSRQSDASSAGDVLNQDYIFPDSDSCYLTEEAVNALSKTEAGYAYKEILARRGCIFKTERYQSYFEGKSWYAGRISEDEFTSDMLNKFELYNLQLIKKLKAD